MVASAKMLQSEHGQTFQQDKGGSVTTEVNNHNFTFQNYFFLIITRVPIILDLTSRIITGQRLTSIPFLQKYLIKRTTSLSAYKIQQRAGIKYIFY